MKICIPSNLYLYFSLLVLGIAGFFLTILLPKSIGFYAFAAVLALGGFFVSLNIWQAKRGGRELACPIGSSCNAVVTSKYSKFFGIHLEYWGMLYFFIAAILYAVFVIKGGAGALNGNALLSFSAFTIAAALFSSYLLFVQAFLLKKWCIWCILVATFSLSLFFISISNLPAVSTFLASIPHILAMIKFLGFALGLGGATSAVFMFFHSFLRDARIDDKEWDILRSVSEIVWLGAGLVWLSELALYVAYPVSFGQSGAFLAQIVSLFVMVITGAVLMIILAPFLTCIPFSENKESFRLAGLSGLRKPIFAIGAIALASWYFAFTMNFITEYSFSAFILAYGGVIAAAIIFGLVLERFAIQK